MDNSTYITEIVLPGLKWPLYPAVPTSSSAGAINVLCGPNNSGKSHILCAIATIMGKKQASKIYPGYKLVLNKYNGDVRFFLSGPHWTKKDAIGIISNRYKRIDPNKPSDFRNFSLKFFYEQLQGDTSYGPNDIPNEQMIKSLDRISDNEFELKECNSNHKIVVLIEETLGAKLLYRKVKGNIEFMLANPTGLVVPYPEWSDGQKTIFYFYLCVEYWHPSILFVDEIENHLHPLYMSKVLSFIKSNVPQTFVATHHPHIIFSEYTDQAFYIETVESRTSYVINRYTKVQQQKAPKRIVSTLSNAFAKLAATYKLFDVQDRQLLKQAAQIEGEADFLLYSEIIEMFYPGVVPSSGKLLPDRQTLDIMSLLKSATNKSRLSLLDYGSGIGRVIKEFEKANSKTSKEITWHCWEPRHENRKTLRQELLNSTMKFNVLDKLEDLEKHSCDIVIVANVVHELNPLELSELLTSIQQYLAADGALLLAEIHPLLRSEKYAVPYPYAIMSELLNSLGFTCSSRNFPVRDSQAYCIIAKPHKQLPDHKEIVARIENAWSRIKDIALSSYHTRMGVNDSIDYRGVLMELSTIASIEAWKSGLWRQHVYV